jgi:hypothetical protein
MKIRPLAGLMILVFLFSILPGILRAAEDMETRITKASNDLFDPATSKEKMVNSLIELLDITISLTESSKYSDEIKHHIDVAKDLFKNSSIFNEKAHQYLSLAYRMVTGGAKYQKPPELDEFITPAEAQEKALKYAKKLVEDAHTSVRKCNEGNAARLILELVLLIVTPISG